ncbi:3-ketoacyl-CoA synthase [Trifolium repens]|nr:3-ketoacyl-CoA synthase [Trifolium repens]
MYGFFDDDEFLSDFPPPNKFLQTKVAKKISCSENGRTNGPSVVMFVLRASPPISIKSLLIFSPFNF